MKPYWTILISVARAIILLAFLVGAAAVARAGGLVAAWGDPELTLLSPGVNDVKAVSASYHTLALRTDGTVVGWGSNYWGEATLPAGLPEIRAVAAGAQFSVVLTAGGDVFAWGDYTAGQTRVPSGLANVVAISAGGLQALALQANGTVVAWGNNGIAQTHVPPGLSNVVEIACGIDFNLALRADGTVIAWGENNFGQTNVPAGLSNVVAIAGGGGQSLALKDDGTVVAWGDNTFGQAAVPAGLSNVIAIAAGANHSLALRIDGTCVAWGSDEEGQTNVPTVLTNVEAIAAGYYGNLAIVPDGPIQLVAQSQTLYLPVGSNVTFTASVTGGPPLGLQWLDNGIPVTNSARVTGANSSSLAISNLQSSDTGSYQLTASNTYGSVIGPTDFLTVGPPLPPSIFSQPASKAISLGGTATLRVQATGALPLRYQWSFNGIDIPGATNNVLTLGPLTRDQTGYYDVEIDNLVGTTFSTKALLTVVPVVVWGAAPRTNFPAGLTNVVALADSSVGFMLVALKSDGSIANWDNGTQLAAPPAGSNFVAIAASGNLGEALRSDGTVAAWMASQYDDCQYTVVPTNLSNVVEVPAPGVALRSDGTVKGWGCHSSVGSGLSNVVAFSTGTYQSLAVKSDGTVVAFGRTNVPAGLSNVIAVAAGFYHSLALKADGTVVAWGSYYPLPTGLSNIVAIAAGASNSLALGADGTLFADTQGGPPASLTNVEGITLGYYQYGSYSVSSGAAAIGTGSPNFTIQPQSRSVSQGATVRFHARAVGIQPLQYQWTFNGTNIPGATTGDLTVNAVQPKDTGSYQVIASNASGTLASTIAVLGIPFAVQPVSANLAAALGATNLSWTTSYGVAGWFAETNVTHDGVSAGQSGPIGDSQQSILQTAVSGPGTLTFWWKVSSEEGFDLLSFTVDGAMPIPAISGEVDWEQETVAIAAGSHQLDWVYSKDPSVSVGQDAGWLDQVTFTSTAPVPQLLRAAAVLTNGTFVLTSVNADGSPLQAGDVARFEAQTSSDLVDWVTLPGAINLTNGSLLITDCSCSNASRRFYRVIEH